MKKFKGFTLIELIIVMAIFGILMMAIMRMFTPIRETYVDSTLYENQRTTQNGIITYITESVRYSTDLGIYNTGGVTTAQKAVNTFADNYCTHYAVDSAKVADVKNLIQEKVDVIVIDNSGTTYGGKTCYGRIIRRKQDGTKVVSDAYDTSPAKARLALGAAYYDTNTYSIGLDVSTLAADGTLGVTVASTAEHGRKNLTRSESEKVNKAATTDLSTLDLIDQSGSVLCRNLTNNTDFGVGAAGMVDYDPTASPALYSGSTTIKGSKTYIVFVDYDLKKELEKAAY